MFERFSGSARLVVMSAQQVARETGSGVIDSPELLVALLRVEDEMTERLLAGHELKADELAEEFRRARRRGGLTDADAAALNTFGVDVDKVVRSVEEALGQDAVAEPARRRRFLEPKGHVPFSVEAKRTLEQCLREALRRKHKHIGTEHLLLALLSRNSIAAEALTSRGITYDRVTELLAKAS